MADEIISEKREVLEKNISRRLRRTRWVARIAALATFASAWGAGSASSATKTSPLFLGIPIAAGIAFAERRKAIRSVEGDVRSYAADKGGSPHHKKQLQVVDGKLQVVKAYDPRSRSIFDGHYMGIGMQQSGLSATAMLLSNVVGKNVPAGADPTVLYELAAISGLAGVMGLVMDQASINMPVYRRQLDNIDGITPPQRLRTK